AEAEARRKEILTLLDATAAADPELGARTEDLRRRLIALAPGERPAELLARVRDQRRSELARVRDELALRALGVRPPSVALLAAEQSGLRDALAAARQQLAAFDEASPAPALDDAGRTRRRAALAPARVARPRLVRARFEHAPHLMQADCSRCHQGIEASKQSSDLFVPGV